MNIKLFEYIAAAVENITALCNKVIDSTDAEQYADGVLKLNANVDATFDKMRELIEADDRLSTEEKLKRLDDVAARQIAARESCERAIKENRESVLRAVKEIVAAITTCGLVYVPKVIDAVEKKQIGKSACAELEEPKRS